MDRKLAAVRLDLGTILLCLTQGHRDAPRTLMDIGLRSKEEQGLCKDTTLLFCEAVVLSWLQISLTADGTKVLASRLRPVGLINQGTETLLFFHTWSSPTA